MSDVIHKRIEEMERYQGEYETGQRFYYVARSLGVSAWGMNLIEMPAGWAHYPAHDHLDDGQEEVYMLLKGSASLEVDGETLLLEPGAMVRVGPAVKRKLTPGDEGATLLAIGGTPGKAYEVPYWG